MFGAYYSRRESARVRKKLNALNSLALEEWAVVGCKLIALCGINQTLMVGAQVVNFVLNCPTHTASGSILGRSSNSCSVGVANCNRPHRGHRSRSVATCVRMKT